MWVRFWLRESTPEDLRRPHSVELRRVRENWSLPTITVAKGSREESWIRLALADYILDWDLVDRTGKIVAQRRHTA